MMATCNNGVKVVTTRQYLLPHSIITSNSLNNSPRKILKVREPLQSSVILLIIYRTRNRSMTNGSELEFNDTKLVFNSLFSSVCDFSYVSQLSINLGRDSDDLDKFFCFSFTATLVLFGKRYDAHGR